MAKILEYRCYLLFICCIACVQVTAQKKYTLHITSTDNKTDLLQALPLQTTFTQKNVCWQYAQQLPALLATRGYISAAIDSIWQTDSTVYLQLFVGEKYVWNQFAVATADWPLLNQLGVYPQTFATKPFNQQKLQQLFEQLIQYFADNGYPFATVGLDSVKLEQGNISAKLHIEKANAYLIDTVIVSGNIKISANFINRYLGINNKDVYRQNKIDDINQRLATLPFLVQYQPYQIEMVNTGAVVRLYLNSRSSNQINALVGFQPANQQLGGKLLLTGEANINLRNPFGNAETLAINWQQLLAKSPRLNLSFQRPYIGHSPLGVTAGFELYKRDSFFITVQGKLGANYAISGKKQLSVFVQWNNTAVLNMDTSYIKITKRLPDIADLATTGIVLQYDFNNTNYRFNPRMGNELQLSTGFASKNIQRNSAVLAIKDEAFNYSSLYDTVKQKTYAVKSKMVAAHYFPLGKQATLKTGVQAAWLQSANYYQNEMYQIGGFKTLRGFDEEGIFTNRYAIGTVEYRYLLAQNGYFFVFTDGGYAAYKSNSTSNSHTYISAGTGISLETKTGIFTIAYALGKRNDVQLDVRQSKIHIGFVSIF
ncbi:BamA/TamA family outer membrane protein [Limnovirga soli]|uniref:BamA/TamA family outer membrane protein n=1 Tax=Limnovirga soli TaxID=2656915 RepID=A0A8J8JUL8_9BACT|nr:BamA/TamA family outer membrane protein [Limnovirga soli]NNV56435.1 BamA/TamA family outer membrane protein [Limnovirga soli]